MQRNGQPLASLDPSDRAKLALMTMPVPAKPMAAAIST
jgi:hypothetical protein